MKTQTKTLPNISSKMSCEGRAIAHPNDDSVIYKQPSVNHIVSPLSNAPVSGRAGAEFVQDLAQDAGYATRDYVNCIVVTNADFESRLNDYDEDVSWRFRDLFGEFEEHLAELNSFIRQQVSELDARLRLLEPKEPG
jgi:hypothetical protein